ncbi:hypothetical protein L228DRAFT_102689 [Xylona heveae TC161]|uniref:C2H2-type domain-containing protein n=1 Tax=Xylona heveae (strain CBS 132557 / TC161) TaxID=1328760 RepID=A0A161TFB6_XYLHT|nr:hypothetical protein L228DRAFT_102689 [Xylona heveae TC161]KZF24707.1 hypothetical protein L228DRAFT_102689 [Xylona heveae TC161]
MELQETGMISNEPQEDDTTKPVTSGEQCDLPHKHLRRMIMDKFPEGDPQLIERIATECWTLYCGLKEGYAESEKQARKDAHSDRDSGNGSKLQSKAVRIALSILKDFENSNVEKNICFDEHFPHSYSFPGAPSPPVPLKIGPLFLCTICSKLVPVFSDVDIWRRHIFDHISPYICTFQDCPERQHRFSSLSSWTDHEFNCHRKPSKWQCIFCLPCSEQSYIYFGLRNFEAHLDLVHRECYSAEDKFSIMEKCKRSPVKNTAKKATCPFCATELQNKRRMIAGHVGRHLEDIALPIASIFLAAEESDREFIDSNSAGVSDNLLSNPEHNLPKCNETGSCLWGLSKADWKHVIGGRSTENELHKHMNPQHDADPLFPDFPFSCFEHESNQESSYDQHMKWKYDLDSVLGMNYDNQPHHYAKSRDSVAPCSSTPDREPEDGGPEFPALLRLMRSKIHHYAGERPSENIFDEKVQELESPASKIIQEQQLREELQKIFFRRAGFLLSKNPGPFTPEHNNNSSLVDEPRVSSETVTRDISFCHICEEVNLTLPIIYCKIGKCRKRWHRKCQTARDVIYQECKCLTPISYLIISLF